MKKRAFMCLAAGMLAAAVLTVSAPASTAAGNRKTITTTKNTSKSMPCPKASRTQTKSVSSSSKSIKGTDSLNSGYITGKYTGTQKTVVTDSFTKGKTTKVRHTIVTTTKNYTMTPSDLLMKKVKAAFPQKAYDAWNALGFQLRIQTANSGRHSFLGDSREILMSYDFRYDDLYYMLGHFLAFISSYSPSSEAFRAVFSAESRAFPGSNKVLAVQNTGNYFAACVQEYCTYGARLKKACPKSYAAVEEAADRILDQRIRYLKKVYRIA